MLRADAYAGATAFHEEKKPTAPTWTELLETGEAGALMSGSVCRRPAITG